jgi:predicted small metal-binding protein
MSGYIAECQALGFICDWHSTASNKSAAASALLQHINSAHGTGTSSPVLSSLIERHVTNQA